MAYLVVVVAAVVVLVFVVVAVVATGWVERGWARRMADHEASDRHQMYWVAWLLVDDWTLMLMRRRERSWTWVRRPVNVKERVKAKTRTVMEG